MWKATFITAGWRVGHDERASMPVAMKSGRRAKYRTTLKGKRVRAYATCALVTITPPSHGVKMPARLPPPPFKEALARTLVYPPARQDITASFAIPSALEFVAVI